jgi:hypothetical protein
MNDTEAAGGEAPDIPASPYRTNLRWNGMDPVSRFSASAPQGFVRA